MNNIVSYLQIDAKNDLIFEEHFDFIDVLKSIFSTFQVQCNQKGILFSQLISPELPRYLKADKTKITTIIQNLLNNALKFSEKGVIKIEIKHHAQDNIQNLSKCLILIAVTDEGKGLNGKTLKDLVLNNKKEGHNGFGLGLFIVKKYVEKLNGSFELSNNETIGCKAEVKFESTIDPKENSEDTFFNLNSNTQNKKLSILLVEDDLTNSYTLQKILERKGNNVICVDKGRDAFTELIKKSYDIVLIDLGLPDMNGLEVAKCIRLGGEFSLEKEIPIIALSANADPIEMQDCVKVGINEYLTKPINKELLISKMNELVK
jgi:CheY-like chemotaxis protein/two-component sensor histidine kinase